jgi:NADP-dependent 3-hydroxy acid dehydrogenase YdfG
VQTPQQQAILAELQAIGAEIQVAQVDVADEAAMTHLLQSVAATAYPLRGVIHAAGVEGFQPLQSLQWAEFARVLHPKMMGGWLLHRLTRTLELDLGK